VINCDNQHEGAAKGQVRTKCYPRRGMISVRGKREGILMKKMTEQKERRKGRRRVSGKGVEKKEEGGPRNGERGESTRPTVNLLSRTKA